MLLNTKRFYAMSIAAILILLTPLIAMQFTNEVKWGIGDFAVMTLLLASLVFTIEYIMQHVHQFSLKLFFILLGVVLFLIIWAEMAVGIFGSPIAGS